MSKDQIDAVISAVTTLALAGLGVLAYSLDAHELGAALVGGALGHAMPTRKPRASSVGASS